MKKQIALVLTLALGLFPGGCANQQTVAPASSASGIVETSSSSSEKSAGSSSAAAQSVSKAVWPTKDWSESTPGEQGMDAAQLAKADERIRDHYPNVYSLLVVRHGTLVYEKYYKGMSRYSANPVYSVTKSVISALTGIAMREKLINNVNQRIADFLPDYFTGLEPEKKEITIKESLTMTGGLTSVDKDFGPYYSSPDWMEYALKQPLISKPGGKFDYNTGLPHFLSVIITKTSGMNTKEFAEKYLFSKIGVSPVHWDQDSKGYYGGGFGLYLTPREMAKFGYLYFNHGKWDGEQIVPEAWVSESLQKHASVDKGVDYGYLFWLQPMRDPVSGKIHDTYRADGAGGQKIIMVPDLDLVAVVTADASVSDTMKDGASTEKIISDYVFPAVK
jgi:CubicO group peptidase (beta-lactamase class C family)